jgi:hypothetical protein
MNRRRQMIDIVEPVLERQHRPMPKDLKPEDIATNKFIDPSMSLAVRQ